MFGTVRSRVGYDVNHWLYYVTGGLSWTFDQFTRTQLTGSPVGGAPAGTVETSFLGRIGWTVGAGLSMRYGRRECAWPASALAAVRQLFQQKVFADRPGNRPLVKLRRMRQQQLRIYVPLKAERERHSSEITGAMSAALSWPISERALIAQERRTFLATQVVPFRPGDTPRFVERRMEQVAPTPDN
jgi:hypothetical protein